MKRLSRSLHISNLYLHSSGPTQLKDSPIVGRSEQSLLHPFDGITSARCVSDLCFTLRCFKKKLNAT